MVRSPLPSSSLSFPPPAGTPAVSLKADHFEGGRFDFNKQLNQKFFLSHSVNLGLVEVRP